MSEENRERIVKIELYVQSLETRLAALEKKDETDEIQEQRTEREV